jgi:hypothetical protein
VIFVRSRSAKALNALLNHSSIRQHLVGDDRLDGTELLESGAVFYLSDVGGSIFHQTAPGVWEGHYLFLPEGRGKLARDLALGMIEAFMLEAGRPSLWGRILVGNRPARLFTRSLGFVSAGISGAPLPSEIFIWKQARGRDSRDNHRIEIGNQKGGEGGQLRC